MNGFSLDARHANGGAEPVCRPIDGADGFKAVRGPP